MAVSWMIALGGAYVVFTIPDQYESSARIYVDTESLLAPLLQGIAIPNDPRRQIKMMQDTLLSKPNLRKVALASDLDLDATTPADLDKVITSISDHTLIEPESSTLFKVSYIDSDPQTAKNVVQALLNIFVESNLGQNRSEMESARSFIEKQIALYEKKLKEAEHRMAAFRAKNADILGTTNFAQRLQAKKTLLEQATFDYSDAVSKRDQLRAQLQATSRMVSMETAPQVVVGGQGALTTLQRIRLVQSQLDDLLLQYTEGHPDVIAARRQLNRLVDQFNREQSGEGPGGLPSNLTNTSKLPNPIYDEIQIRLIDAEAATAQTKRRLDQIKKEMDQLQEYATIAPALDAEMSDISRDYSVIKKNYDQLLARRESARISQAVESDTESVKFQIVEPPEVPTSPVSPNRPLFLGALLMIAIGAGGGAAFLRTQVEDTFYTPEQLENAFQIPVLGTVTQVLNVQEGAKRAAKTLGFLVASGVFFAFFVALYAALILFYTPAASAATTTVSRLF